MKPTSHQPTYHRDSHTQVGCVPLDLSNISLCTNNIEYQLQNGYRIVPAHKYISLFNLLDMNNLPQVRIKTTLYYSKQVLFIRS